MRVEQHFVGLQRVGDVGYGSAAASQVDLDDRQLSASSSLKHCC